MAKRAGRGNDGERTLAETRTGEMGISCIACPRPGVNLPEGWDRAPKHKAYVYPVLLMVEGDLKYVLQVSVLAVYCD